MSNNSIGIRAAHVIANLKHEDQDLIADAIREPNEAKKMLGEIARMRAEDAFELGHERAVRATVDRAVNEAISDASAGLPANVRRIPAAPKTFPKNTKRAEIV